MQQGCQFKSEDFPRACLPFNVQASFVLSAAAEARKVEARRRHLLLRLVRVRVRIRVRVRVRVRVSEYSYTAAR